MFLYVDIVALNKRYEVSNEPKLLQKVDVSGAQALEINCLFTPSGLIFIDLFSGVTKHLVSSYAGDSSVLSLQHTGIVHEVLPEKRWT
ncbi:hypothetical protein [Chitinophaga pinensis]|uniref:Uncharacterized protein n=1 Tax=Chitinophaga pinensis TaxID=79329 RepID=A0A5C6LQC2_9BACT|nr:hypothetical protein [Chitinophaga pinensis]TWV99520.1 hypothetical protein FEF09_16145 [Chitinophaga pinensis]